MNTTVVSRPPLRVVSVVVVRDETSLTLVPFEAEANRLAELSYEYADESLGRSAGLVN